MRKTKTERRTEQQMTKKIKSALRTFLRDKAGATAIEYSLIAAAVFLGIAPLIAAMDVQMHNTYQQILDYFSVI